MPEKKYYYFKLENTFFDQKEIKKLRRIPGGDAYTVIYLKMILSSLETNGVLFFEGFEDSFSKEVALVLDENPDAVEITVVFLKTHKLLVECAPDEYSLVNVQEKIDGLSASAIRKRRQREREKQLETPAIYGSMGQSHAQVTPLSRLSHVHVTGSHEISDQDQETDQDRETDPSINQEGLMDGWTEYNIREEMVRNRGIPYVYSTNKEFMKAAIHILSAWDQMMSDEDDWYGHEEYKYAYVMLNDALVDMCTTQEIRKYGDTPAVSYAKVIDKINQCSVLFDNDTKITICNLIHEMLDALVNALVKYKVTKTFPYVRSFIWSYLNTYKLRSAIEKAKIEDGYYLRLRYHGEEE